MVKVKCKDCGDTGYTASPEHVICKCGGRLKAIPEHCLVPKSKLKRQPARELL